MTSFLLSLFWIMLAVYGVVALKTYTEVPLKELKRRAGRNDTEAGVLYRAAAYGKGLHSLLWFVVALSGAAAVVLLTKTVPVLVAVLLVAVLLWMTFSWLPKHRVSSFGYKATALATPLIVWLLSKLHPLLSRAKTDVASHTGMFEASDLLSVLSKQADQADNRLSIEELAIVQRALAFGDLVVRDILTPRKQIEVIASTETLGPIVIDELHKSTAPFVLVMEGTQVVGSLETQKLGLHTSGPVTQFMTAPIYYLHENDTLREALHAMFVTNHPVFVVVNSAEEYVGIVTTESIVRQLLGHLPGDEFEQYSDLTLVAGRHTKKKADTKNG